MEYNFLDLVRLSLRVRLLLACFPYLSLVLTCLKQCCSRQVQGSPITYPRFSKLCQFYMAEELLPRWRMFTNIKSRAIVTWSWIRNSNLLHGYMKVLIHLVARLAIVQAGEFQKPLIEIKYKTYRTYPIPIHTSLYQV